MTVSKSKPHAKQWLDTWHVNPVSNREYDFIDGLRGVAILMVLVAHHFYINPESGAAMHYLGALSSRGGAGVKIFFALSGFLISWPFWKRKISGAGEVIPKGYVQRRFWKIYPPMALSVLVFTPLYILRNQDWSYLPTAIQWLTGLSFLMPVNGKLNPVMWTLMIEVQFYITLPVFFLFLKRFSIKSSFLLVTLAFLVIPCGFQIMTGKGASFTPNIDANFPAELSAFYSGILIAGLQCRGLLTKGWAKFGWVGVILWPILIFSLAWYIAFPEDGGLLFFNIGRVLESVAAGCLLLFVANPQSGFARLLCASWLRWLGIISYELYLIHQPIILGNRHFFGPANGSLPMFAGIVGGSLLLSTVLAALIYRYFSLPILKYGREPK